MELTIFCLDADETLWGWKSAKLKASIDIIENRVFHGRSQDWMRGNMQSFYLLHGQIKV